MALAVAIGLVVVALLVMWIAVAREPGPSAAETAVAYEHAWQRLDYGSLYDLSGDELRDRLDRRAFVASKRASIAPHGPSPEAATDSTIEVVSDEAVRDAAFVVTNVTVADAAVRNDVTLVRRDGRWYVVAYGLADIDNEPNPPTTT